MRIASIVLIKWFYFPLKSETRFSVILDFVDGDDSIKYISKVAARATLPSVIAISVWVLKTCP